MGKASWQIPKTKKYAFNEANLLKLNCDKASHILNWSPVMNFNETASFTTKWYKKFYSRKLKSYEVGDLISNDIDQYLSLKKKKNIKW